MQTERRVSGHFIEGLFGRLRGTELEGALQDAGLELGAVAESYPAEVLAPWVGLVARRLYPETPPAEAIRRVAFDFVARKDKYRGISLAEALAILPSSLEHAGNFWSVDVRSTRDGTFVATFDDVACLHTFFQGVLEAVTTSTAGPGVEVRWQPAGLSGARYELRTSKPSENLAGVEKPTGVQRRLERAHQLELGGAA